MAHTVADCIMKIFSRYKKSRYQYRHTNHGFAW